MKEIKLLTTLVYIFVRERCISVGTNLVLGIFPNANVYVQYYLLKFCPQGSQEIFKHIMLAIEEQGVSAESKFSKKCF